LHLHNINIKKSYFFITVQFSEMLAALIVFGSEVVGSIPDLYGLGEKGYELNKVEFEGQTCPSHLKNGCFTA
jgi:hypothetical protein